MEATFQQFSSMLFKLRSHLLPLLGCICFLLFNIKCRFPVTSVYYFSLWCQQTNQPKCLYCVRSGKKLDWYIPIQKACLHSYYQNHRYLVIVLFLILCGIWHFSVCLFWRKDQFFCRLTVKWRVFPANTCCNTCWVLRHHQKKGEGTDNGHKIDGQQWIQWEKKSRHVFIWKCHG